MEQYISPELLTGNSSKQQAQQQQQQQLQAAAAFDFFSFNSSPSDVLAPHPDLFESDLDSHLVDFDSLNLSFLTVDPTDAYALLRAETPTCGPPSTITVSSESASAYESLSSQSEAYYNYSTQYSFPIDLDMSYSRLNINARDDYLATARAQNTASGLSVDAVSEGSYGSAEHSPSGSGFTASTYDEQEASLYGTLPPTPPERHTGSVYSDYAGSDYYLAPATSSHHPSLYGTVAPAAIAAQQQQAMHQPQARAPSPVGAGLAMHLLPNISRSDPRSARGMYQTQNDITQGQNRRESDDDPRKKYQCVRCSKAFARAYNLKTHMDTHNPDRVKSFTCPHTGCGRAFSRKHDLGRHLVSIHRGDPTPSTTGDASDDGSESRIGVGAKVYRHRCDKCGKSGPKRCSCVDVK